MRTVWGRLTVGACQALEACGQHMDSDMDNLVDLDAFSEGSILHHVRKRAR
jgi:hypothetical protein